MPRVNVVLAGAFVMLASLVVLGSGSGSKANPADQGAQTKPSILAAVDPAKNVQTFTWDQLKSGGAAFTVRNPGENPRTLVAAREVIFERFPQAETPPVEAKGPTMFAVMVGSVPSKTQIAGYDSQRFQLTLPGQKKSNQGPTVQPDQPVQTNQSAQSSQPIPGVYLTTFQVDDSDAKNQPLSLQIRITVPGPRPLVAKTSTTIYRVTPFGCWLNPEVTIPLLNPQVLSTPVGRVVGGLRKATGDWIKVTWAAPESGAKSEEVRLLLKQPPSAGIYEGDLTLSEDPDKVQINVSVVAKDIVLWPILVIAAGTWMAYKVKRYVGLLRITLTLKAREAGLGVLLEQSNAAFQANVGDAAIGAYSIDADVAEQRAKIRKIANGFEKTLATTLDTTSTDYKFVHDSLQALETGIAAWPELGISLAALAAAKAATLKGVASVGVTPPAPLKMLPDFCSTAQDLLTGKPVLVADIAALKQEGDDLTTLAGAWQKAFTEAAGVIADCEQAKDKAVNPTDIQKAAINGLPEQTRKLWNDLMEAKELDDLKGVQADLTDLRNAETTILGEDFTLKGHLPLGFVSLESLAGGLPQAKSESAVAGSPELSANDQLRAEILLRSIARRDIEAAVFAGFIGLLTGLNQLYLGQPFGTCKDYVGLFLWAAGTKVALDLLTGVVDKFGSMTA